MSWVESSAGVGGTAADIEIQADMLTKHKREMAELIAEHTGQNVERIEADSDRDRWFTAEEAREYGFVDHVLTRTSQLPD
jgi:ATP-dependent Clp protease protease subunit